jgi:PPOX class probable F420-dependent enzyme
MYSTPPEEWRAFLEHGTRTAKLGTVRAGGRPHVAPVWFVLDGDELVLMTGAESVKGRGLRRDGRVCLCADDERPPYAFVIIEGRARVSGDVAALRPRGGRHAPRYMGPDKAREYGARNAVAGELLVRVSMERVLAQGAIAG